MKDTITPPDNCSTQKSSSRVHTIEKFFFSDEVRFTTINNQPLQADIRDMAALGIYCYLCSLPGDWKIIPKQIAAHFNINVDTVRNKLKILIECGYLFFLRFRIQGKFGQGKYLVFQSPLTPERKEEIKKMFPNMDFSGAVTIDSVNTNNTKNTEKQRTDTDVSVARHPAPIVHNSDQTLRKPGVNGEEHVCTKDAFWLYCVKKKFECTKDELEVAWKIFASYTLPVTCWQKFVAGVITNQRKPKWNKKTNSQKNSKTTKKNISDDATEEQALPIAPRTPFTSKSRFNDSWWVRKPQ